MILEYEMHATIDHSNPVAKKRYARTVKEWRRACIEKVASRKALRKGGMRLKRELDRKGCTVEDKEIEKHDMIIHTFKAGDRTISKLFVTFENYEREEEELEEVGV